MVVHKLFLAVNFCYLFKLLAQKSTEECLTQTIEYNWSCSWQRAEVFAELTKVWNYKKQHGWNIWDNNASLKPKNTAHCDFYRWYVLHKAMSCCQIALLIGLDFLCKTTESPPPPASKDYDYGLAWNKIFLGLQLQLFLELCEKWLFISCKNCVVNSKL